MHSSSEWSFWRRITGIPRRSRKGNRTYQQAIKLFREFPEPEKERFLEALDALVRGLESWIQLGIAGHVRGREEVLGMKADVETMRDQAQLIVDELLSMVPMTPRTQLTVEDILGPVDCVDDLLDKSPPPSISEPPQEQETIKDQLDIEASTRDVTTRLLRGTDVDPGFERTQRSPPLTEYEVGLLERAGAKSALRSSTFVSSRYWGAATLLCT